MTTIVWSGTEIAADGRYVVGCQIITEEYIKFRKYENYIFFLSGQVHAFELFMKHIVDGRTKPDEKVRGTEALVYHNGQVWHGAANSECIYLLPCTSLGSFAIGSGADFAISAIKLGKSVEEAVRFASTMDIYTGNKASLYTLAELEQMLTGVE